MKWKAMARTASAVKSMDSFCRRSEFNSQHPGVVTLNHLYVYLYQPMLHF